MHLDFLCDAQRAALTQSPEDAGAVWTEALKRLAVRSDGPTPLRVALAGTALESALIFLERYPRATHSSLEQFALTVDELTAPLVELGKLNSAIAVVARASVFLSGLAAAGADPKVANSHRARLIRQGREWVAQRQCGRRSEMIWFTEANQAVAELAP